MHFADPREAREFLAAHPEVRSIELFLIDANGVPRGKLLHRDEPAGGLRKRAAAAEHHPRPDHQWR